MSLAVHLKPEDATAFDKAMQEVGTKIDALAFEGKAWKADTLTAVTDAFKKARDAWNKTPAEGKEAGDFNAVVCKKENFTANANAVWDFTKEGDNGAKGENFNSDIENACKGGGGIPMGVIIGIVVGVVVIGGGLAFYCLCTGKGEDADEEESGEDE